MSPWSRKAMPGLGYKRDIVGDLFGDIMGTSDQAAAAGQAAELQSQAALKGIDEQRRQFDKIVELMAPFVSAGTGAIGAQRALVGLDGAGPQAQAIKSIEDSPIMRAIAAQGENAILQNAAATGGLRGGNVQAALAKFRPQVLQSLIEQQFGRLGSLSSMGQASAANQAARGQASAANIASLLQQQGAAQAGGAIAQGSETANTFGNLLRIGGTIAGMF